MKFPVRCAVLLLLFAPFSTLLAQHTLTVPVPFTPADAVPGFTAEQMKKVGSGMLLQHLAQKISAAQARGVSAAGENITVAVYFAQYPSIADLASLTQLGARCMPESWIPPMENHPLGFFIAQVPTNTVADVLSLSAVLKMDSAEGESMPMNNAAAVAVKATLAWAAGWTGDGVKVAVIDSGLDYTLPKTELPDSLWYRSYAYYPDSVTSFVSNTVNGHGTHVTGTVLGKGGYSSSPVLNTGNGGGAYKGMAPGAKLVFLKIGNNTTSSATGAAEIAAIKAAADTFGVRVINLSYGGWDAYHDGSNAESQAMDYAFSKGVACFVAAGNEASSARHYSGSVAANDSTDFIQINVSGAGVNNTALYFNLVWRDGGAGNNLALRYYAVNHQPLSDIVTSSTTASPRGTKSQFSFYNLYVNPGTSTYYLRVKNLSASAQAFHLYEVWGNGAVRFAAADPLYTVSSPAYADHAMAVAAYTSRVSWTDYAGNGWTYSNPLNDVTAFSNRGPRIDGVQKPDITAPGSALISIRDRDVFKTADKYWVDNDGTVGGNANYYVMQGTSMASPVAAGCAALMLQHTPSATPQQVYDAMKQTAMVDLYTGSVPNTAWGYGKLDVNAAIADPALPVELASFTSSARGGSVLLSWRTASEVNNLGFDVERRRVVSSVSDPSVQAQGGWISLGFVSGHGTDNQPHDYTFADQSSVAGARYAYRLKQIDRDGKFEYSTVIESAADAAPLTYALAQNYPNPFNPSTSIEFTVASAGPVRLAVYDLLGRQTAELVKKTMEPGSYVADWNASRCPSGVYFYRLEAGTYTAVKKLLLQK